jgi:hypothetical protein
MGALSWARFRGSAFVEAHSRNAGNRVLPNNDKTLPHASTFP